MFRSVLLCCVVLAAFSSLARAQCVPFGNGCASSGMQLICSTPPQVGTGWRIGERSAAACGYSSSNPGQIITQLGFCFGPPGIPINPPIACPNCTGCSLDVFPVLGSVTWTWPPRTHTINIPSNPSFIGVQFCAQDICTNTSQSCVCLSNAIQVTVQ